MPHDEVALDAEARHEVGRLPGDVMPVVVGILEIGAAVALEVDRDEAIALVHEGQDVMPGIPALRQAVEEQDHLAVGCPRLDVVPADAVDDPIVVVVRRVDRIVGCLEVRPEPRVFGGQTPGAARGGNPDERCHHRAEASEAQQGPRPKTALQGTPPFPAEPLTPQGNGRSDERASATLLPWGLAPRRPVGERVSLPPC